MPAGMPSRVLSRYLAHHSGNSDDHVPEAGAERTRVVHDAVQLLAPVSDIALASQVPHGGADG
jgi:hypothetical protein